MEDIAGCIKEYTENLDSLQIAFQQLSEAVEEKTNQAREKLTQYKELKERAEKAFAEAAENYKQAENLFDGSDGLWQRLQIIRKEYRKFCKKNKREKITLQARAVNHKFLRISDELKQMRLNKLAFQLSKTS
jgi:uncharacterized coiled-coil DUF342 family protein